MTESVSFYGKVITGSIVREATREEIDQAVYQSIQMIEDFEPPLVLVLGGPIGLVESIQTRRLSDEVTIVVVDESLDIVEVLVDRILARDIRRDSFDF